VFAQSCSRVLSEPLLFTLHSSRVVPTLSGDDMASTSSRASSQVMTASGSSRPPAAPSTASAKDEFYSGGGAPLPPPQDFVSIGKDDMAPHHRAEDGDRGDHVPFRYILSVGERLRVNAIGFGDGP